MDRNTVIGIVLIVGIVLTWGIITNSNREEESGPRQRTVQTDSTTTTDPVEETQEAAVLPPTPTVDENGEHLDSTQLAIQDSLANRMVQEGKFGYFVELGDGEDRAIQVTTDKLKFELHTKGGVQLRRHYAPRSRWGSKPSRVAPSQIGVHLVGCATELEAMALAPSRTPFLTPASSPQEETKMWRTPR